MKRIQRIGAMLCSIIMLASCLSACNADDTEAALSVGKADVGNDVYAYYLDLVLQNTDDSLKAEDAQKQAEDKCVSYVRINSEFRKLKLSLSSSAKAEVARNVNDMYSMYGGYYEKIGVTKQTLTNVMISEAYKEELVTAIYGEGGEKAVSVEKQKEYFNDNYVFFKAISAYLYTTDDSGKSLKLPEAELATVKEKFESMKGQINADTTIDAVNLAYETENGGQTEAEMDVLSAQKGSDLYPEKFFSDVSSLENKEVKVLEYDNYIFLIQKVDSSTFYADNAKSCLTAMVAEDFEKEIASRYSKLSTNSDSGVMNSTYKTIQRIKGAE